MSARDWNEGVSFGLRQALDLSERWTGDDLRELLADLAEHADRQAAAL